MTPFEEVAGGASQGTLRSFAGRIGRNFALERSGEGGNVFDAVVSHVHALQAQGKRVVVAAFSPGARERLMGLLAEHELVGAHKVESFAEVDALPPGAPAFTLLALEQGV